MITNGYVPSTSPGSLLLDRQVVRLGLNKKSCMLDDADDSDDCDDADEDLSRLQATDAAGEAGIGVGVSSDQGMVIKHLFANPTPVRTPLHISKCR